MIVDLPKTTSVAVSKKLVSLRNDVGAMTLGRVLTLVIVVEDTQAEDVIEAANDASRQHPCRILVVVAGNRRGANRMDAQIRVGGDAGASEVVVLRLYGPLANHGQSVVVPLLLPDSPVVAWWPHEAPADLRKDPIAVMAHRRITDAAESSNPKAALKRQARTFSPGDTDLAWTRVTLWRGLLAAALDGPPYLPVTEAVVEGAVDSPSSDLLAAWLGSTLRVPVQRVRTRAGSGVVGVRLERSNGPIDLVRPDGTVATLSQPGQPDRRISLKRRGLAECLADELRRLDNDEVYAETLVTGLELLTPATKTASEAAAAGEAPSVEEARRTQRRLARDHHAAAASAMVTAPTAPETGDTDQVRTATAAKLADEPTPREQDLGALAAPAKRTAKRTATPKASTKAAATRTTAKRTAKKATS
ncbi:glucose-6-phosphate dehydrogenase assembly protein OpcA [Lapillicoccus jejuensis]|uniref:Glucose-6-phosphate dehydrogenase assembly protein OpcA n=1 Tax=Lapillicoccus jejuensis TaxID=402171 RepID=A0A542E469_9MICO|nr:glucose-6-phosphate dehydrogenase assembly protein OpcA [Lapillicoccus jejuensis]TQJ10117.1 glucose-6-phosphate dehydrogenase assembly protein OpcA [Lapillicoccus jejuensis]